MAEKTPQIELKLAHELKLPSPVLGLAVARDNAAFYASCMDGRIYAVEATKDNPRQIGRHDSYASSVHLLPDQRTLISGGYDGTLQWHDIEKSQTMRRITAHKFWSWQTDLSPDGSLLASVTGQYICGGYKYEPAPEQEPSVKLYSATTGELVRSFSHTPPVQSVAFSPDNRLLAAGNLMGEIRVWDLAAGKELSAWTTPRFTGWGIIKGHYYTGGIFAMKFSPDGKDLYVAGMGSTTDPAAGNGLQLWQRFSWQDGKKLSEAREADIGRGLMEALTFRPHSSIFVMAGRLFNGKWNTALFDRSSGELLHGLDTKMRTTRAFFIAEGKQLLFSGTTDQGKKKDGKYPECGRIKIYDIV
jgi:WD40 repeat protein